MGERTPTASAQKACLQSAQVLVAKPFSADGRELPSSVLKYDTQAVVEAEAALMEEHGKDWGATSSSQRHGDGLLAASQRHSDLPSKASRCAR